ncbi:MAG: DUF3604 domain-containing protein [Polyangiales bacterium]
MARCATASPSGRAPGANPFELGVIASTDTHASIAGAVDERAITGRRGHPAWLDRPHRHRRRRPRGAAASRRRDHRRLGAHGLAGRPRRDLRRGELTPRALRRDAPPRDLRHQRHAPGRSVLRRLELRRRALRRDRLVAQGYAGGVPMGGTLGARGAATAPVFVLSALRDPLSEPLQRLQIVKGWYDPTTGETEELVFDVAGNPDNGASVDLATCESSVPDEGRFDTLCDVWTDPDFDPTAPAFYYVRVVENPSCRWSHRLCLETAVDCDTADPESELYRSCCTDELARTVQERAWTSPIWYLPPR